MTENCPSLVVMGCATTYVSSLLGDRDLCGLHVGHGSDRELQLDVVRRHCVHANLVNTWKNYLSKVMGPEWTVLRFKLTLRENTVNQ